jgi:hypothetical protein
MESSINRDACTSLLKYGPDGERLMSASLASALWGSLTATSVTDLDLPALPTGMRPFAGSRTCQRMALIKRQKMDLSLPKKRS